MVEQTPGQRRLREKSDAEQRQLLDSVLNQELEGERLGAVLGHFCDTYDRMCALVPFEHPQHEKLFALAARNIDVNIRNNINSVVLRRILARVRSASDEMKASARIHEHNFDMVEDYVFDVLAQSADQLYEGDRDTLDVRVRVEYPAQMTKRVDALFSDIQLALAALEEENNVAEALTRATIALVEFEEDVEVIQAGGAPDIFQSKEL